MKHFEQETRAPNLLLLSVTTLAFLRLPAQPQRSHHDLPVYDFPVSTATRNPKLPSSFCYSVEAVSAVDVVHTPNTVWYSLPRGSVCGTKERARIGYAGEHSVIETRNSARASSAAK